MKKFIMILIAIASIFAASSFVLKAEGVGAPNDAGIDIVSTVERESGTINELWGYGARYESENENNYFLAINGNRNMYLATGGEDKEITQTFKINFTDADYSFNNFKINFYEIQNDTENLNYIIKKAIIRIDPLNLNENTNKWSYEIEYQNGLKETKNGKWENGFIPSDYKLRVDFQITEKDLPPIFGPYQEEMAASYNNPPKIADIIASMSAIDEKDGDISHLIVVDAKYNEYTEKPVIGKRVLALKVEDSGGNITQAFIFITLSYIDLIVPNVSLKIGHKIISYLSKPLKYSYLEKNPHDFFDINDNDSNLEDLKITFTDIDNFASSKNEAKIFNLSINVEDLAGNITSVNFQIESIDDIPATIEENFNITISKNKILSKEFVLSQFLINDNIDAEIKRELVTFNYWKNPKKIGVINEKIKATDFTGNVTIQNYTITIIENDFFDIFMIRNVLTIAFNKEITQTTDVIIEYLKSINYIAFDKVATILFDNYTGNEDIPDTYNLIIGTDGQQKTIEINVLSEQDTKTALSGKQSPWYSFSDTIKAVFRDHWKIILTSIIVVGITITVIVVIVKKRNPGGK